MDCERSFSVLEHMQAEQFRADLRRLSPLLMRLSLTCNDPPGNGSDAVFLVERPQTNDQKESPLQTLLVALGSPHTGGIRPIGNRPPSG